MPDTDKGRALHIFKAYTTGNAIGNTNKSSTTTFTQFKSLMPTLVPNDWLKCKVIKVVYEALSQKNCLAEKFGNTYYALVVCIHTNKESSLLHNSHQLKAMFVRKLNLYRILPSSFTLTAPSSPPLKRPLQKLSALTSWSVCRPKQRARPSPFTPPLLMAALLSALGLDAEGNQIAADAQPNRPSTSLNQMLTQLGAVSKDHSVAPGDPVPTMTN
eukprot:2997983-Rhodomonas_salina.4